MMIKKIATYLSLLVLVTGCNVIQKTAKQELTSGFYTQKTEGDKSRVYIDIAEDTIRIYPIYGQVKEKKIDTTLVRKTYALKLQNNNPKAIFLIKKSFDVDFLTIPLKLRPEEKNVPTQLNANLSGAIFIGYRTDRYSIRYKMNPLHVSQRKTTHLGYSLGLFTGLGNTFMSPTNTFNQLQQEYDGVAWCKGISGIFGINNFTLGLTLGFDNLLDDNRDIWIYENSPWIGLAFGLNLN